MTRYDIIKDSSKYFDSISDIVRYIRIQYRIDRFEKECIIYYALYDFFIVINNVDDWIFIKRINFRNVNNYNVYTLFLEHINSVYSDIEFLRKITRVVRSLRVK